MRLLAKCVAGCLILGALALAVSTDVSAQGDKKGEKKGKVVPKVKVGDTAPSFESVDEEGKPFKSSDVVGKKIVVLYFYPADFTGGCTAQACGFRDELDKLGKNVQVIGVSGDSASTHKMFKGHHKLNFPLLADEKGTVASAFGIPVGKGGESPTIAASGEKGKAPRGVTIQRWTVVIDKAGKVAAIDPIGKAGEDAKRVEDIVKKLETK
jgi:peroxiredoxin Q/BCP